MSMRTAPSALESPESWRIVKAGARSAAQSMLRGSTSCPDASSTRIFMRET
jgi:hypothetical protein